MPLRYPLLHRQNYPYLQIGKSKTLWGIGTYRSHESYLHHAASSEIKNVMKVNVQRGRTAGRHIEGNFNDGLCPVYQNPISNADGAIDAPLGVTLVANVLSTSPQEV